MSYRLYMEVGGKHPMIFLQLYSDHGHKRKETFIFLVPLISSPPFSSPPFLSPPSYLSTPFDSFRPLPPCHSFTHHPTPFLGKTISPPPSPLPLSPPPSSPSAHRVASSLFFLPSSCLLPLSFPWILNPLSSVPLLFSSPFYSPRRCHNP